MNDIIEINEENGKIEQYRLLQYENFCEIANLFMEYIFEIDHNNWEEIVKELENVLSRCDEIDYQSDATAMAYAIWHFLDRYHRMQIMCTDLLKEGCLNRRKQYDVLDVGTGPSQVLFALSDHFQNLNKIEKEISCIFNSDYVEQSQGFRNFLHYFVEYALTKGKQYLVPFHHGRTSNVFDIEFNELIESWSTSRQGKYRYYKYRYDVVVFNNFLTTKGFVESLDNILHKICRYMRSYGLIIIIGASSKSKKYREIYPVIDKIINQPFKDTKFYGFWYKLIDKDFNCKYEDEYGCILGEYFNKIITHLKKLNLWDNVSPKAKKEFKDNVKYLLSKDSQDSWNGATWKMVVYRKISKPSYGRSTVKTFKCRNPIRMMDYYWRKEIKQTKDD